MDILHLQNFLATLWEVWFVALFLGLMVMIFRPGKRQYYQEQGLIPLRDEAAPPRSRSI